MHPIESKNLIVSKIFFKFFFVLSVTSIERFACYPKIFDLERFCHIYQFIAKKSKILLEEKSLKSLNSTYK